MDPRLPVVGIDIDFRTESGDGLPIAASRSKIRRITFRAPGFAAKRPYYNCGDSALNRLSGDLLEWTPEVTRRQLLNPPAF
jgi:hypothetical protein